MAKRNRRKKKEAPTFTEEEAKAMSKEAWVKAIEYAVENDRWCDNCGSPIWYIEEEKREFCMTCWAVQNGIEIAKEEFEMKLYKTIEQLNSLQHRHTTKPEEK